MGVDLISVLGALNPTAGEITGLFSGFKAIPSPILQAILQGLDENVLRKLATYSSAFAKKINELGPTGVDPSVGENSPHASDFFSTMNAAGYKGPKLDWDTLTAAADMITLAIKAEDWQQAVAVGMSLAKIVPLA